MSDGPLGLDSLAPHRTAEWLLLLMQLPSQPAKPAGILLRDVSSDTVYVALADVMVEDEEVAEIWGLLKQDLEARASELGGAAFLDSLQGELSHFLQVGDTRQQIFVADPRTALADLMQRYVLNGSGIARAM